MSDSEYLPSRRPYLLATIGCSALTLAFALQVALQIYVHTYEPIGIKGGGIDWAAIEQLQRRIRLGEITTQVALGIGTLGLVPLAIARRSRGFAIMIIGTIAWFGVRWLSLSMGTNIPGFAEMFLGGLAMVAIGLNRDLELVRILGFATVLWVVILDVMLRTGHGGVLIGFAYAGLALACAAVAHRVPALAPTV